VIATVKSSKIVRRNVARSTIASPHEERSKLQNSSFSAMFQATIASTAPKLARGMYAASGAATSINSRM
jgi:hypothetical protein